MIFEAIDLSVLVVPRFRISLTRLGVIDFALLVPLTTSLNCFLVKTGSSAPPSSSTYSWIFNPERIDRILLLSWLFAFFIFGVRPPVFRRTKALNPSVFVRIFLESAASITSSTVTGVWLAALREACLTVSLFLRASSFAASHRAVFSASILSALSSSFCFDCSLSASYLTRSLRSSSDIFSQFSSAFLLAL